MVLHIKTSIHQEKKLNEEVKKMTLEISPR